MKITKAQAQANREHVVETASRLFRERGYDGVGVADLMAAAGFTHGGFYKQFRSKADLMAESAACSIAQTAALSAGVDAPEFVRHYLSREHRDTRATGCTMAALGGDAARQPEAVRATFAAGIESLLAALSPEGTALDGADPDQVRARSLDILAHAVGAIVMSRACPDDSPLADEILAVCRDEILASLSASAPSHDRRISGIQRPADLQNTGGDSARLTARTIQKVK
ncbi:TetR family transcriptional regulator [Burkholderia sp. Ac-20353]|uniref:TetR/AcrR family transcriptional regulator n=1 Tax=Burkholderia sp. Ac-20353 TaxID=2703894 RepID=UPI00197BA9CC|nr:TetR family transcriptional regulator [Burkholderia sp. Ac-20353]MBN3785741.1 TetR family transcriptional regulator [Burkholderia sp. Ac-20353]